MNYTTGTENPQYTFDSEMAPRPREKITCMKENWNGGEIWLLWMIVPPIYKYVKLPFFPAFRVLGEGPCSNVQLLPD